MFYTGDYRNELIKQLTEDVSFLKKHNLMDYSLMVGVHHCKEGEEIKESPNHPAVMGKFD